MKIIQGKKYRVLIECHNKSESDESKFVLLPGEEYVVDFVYQDKNESFVFLKDFKFDEEDESSMYRELSININLFPYIFEEVI